MAAPVTYFCAVVLAAFSGSWLAGPSSPIPVPAPAPTPLEVACAPCPAPTACAPCPTPAAPVAVSGPAFCWPNWVLGSAVLAALLAGFWLGVCSAASLAALLAAVRSVLPARRVPALARGREPLALRWS